MLDIVCGGDGDGDAPGIGEFIPLLLLLYPIAVAPAVADDNDGNEPAAVAICVLSVTYVSLNVTSASAARVRLIRRPLFSSRNSSIRLHTLLGVNNNDDELLLLLVMVLLCIMDDCDDNGLIKDDGGSRSIILLSLVAPPGDTGNTNRRSGARCGDAKDIRPVAMAAPPVDDVILPVLDATELCPIADVVTRGDGGNNTPECGVCDSTFNRGGIPPGNGDVGGDELPPLLLAAANEPCVVTSDRGRNKLRCEP